MHLDEAKEILKNAGYIVEDTSIYSALSDFYRYLKTKALKTGYDLKIEGDEDSITIKFKDNIAKVTLEQFDEDEDAMLYVEAGDDFKAFYNEHADYGNAMQFIIKNICPTNEAKQILKKAGFIIESYAEDTGDPIAVLRRDVTNGAINRFEHAQYDEYEQEPWVEEQNIKNIEFAEFLKVVMESVGANTQQELLDLAEDKEKFNEMVEAWYQYLLNEKDDCMGWDYTWGEI